MPVHGAPAAVLMGCPQPHSRGLSPSSPSSRPHHSPLPPTLAPHVPSLGPDGDPSLRPAPPSLSIHSLPRTHTRPRPRPRPNPRSPRAFVTTLPLLSGQHHRAVVVRLFDSPARPASRTLCICLYAPPSASARSLPCRTTTTSRRRLISPPSAIMDSSLSCSSWDGSCRLSVSYWGTCFCGGGCAAAAQSAGPLGSCRAAVCRAPPVVPVQQGYAGHFPITQSSVADITSRRRALRNREGLLHQRGCSSRHPVWSWT